MASWRPKEPSVAAAEPADDAANGALITSAPQLPSVDEAGQLYRHISHRYMGLVGYALLHIGDAAGLTTEEHFTLWSAANPTDFYTKVAPKFVPKHFEVEAAVTVESLIKGIAAEDRERAIDGSHRVVSEGD